MLTRVDIARLKWSSAKGKNKRTSLLVDDSKSTIEITSKPEGKLGKYYITHTCKIKFGPANEFEKEWKSREHLSVCKKQVVDVVKALIDAGAEFYS